MAEYIFTLKYRLACDDDDQDAIVERLLAGGCDDATIGTGVPGRIALEFSREADSAESAVASALFDIKQCVPTARLIEASPDYVGLTDAAEAVGVSRQNMRQLMVKYRDSFPSPVHEGSVATWHLADILGWLRDNNDYLISEEAMAVAETIKEVNVTVNTMRLLSVKRDWSAVLS